MGMPSTSTSARLAPLAPSPRSETPLRCRIRRLAAGAPQQLKARHLAQLVVGGERTPLLQVACRSPTTASGCDSTLSTPVGRMAGAGRGYVEALLHCRRRKRDGQWRLRQRASVATVVAKPWSADLKSSRLSRDAAEDECPIGLRHAAEVLPFDVQRHLRARYDRAAWVLHNAAHLVRRQGP